MHTLQRPAAMAMLYGLAIGIFAWTSYLTYSFVAGALPGLGLVAPLLALLVFDAGVVAWALVYLHYAAGAPQVLVALIGAVLDLIGVGLMSAAEIWLGTGQTLAAAPPALAAAALWGITGWTFTNAALVLAFHLLSPEARQAQALRAARDLITDKALEQLDRNANELGDQVAGELGHDLWRGAVRELRANQSKPIDSAPTQPDIHSAELGAPTNTGPATPPSTANTHHNPTGNGRHKTTIAPKANGSTGG